MSLINQMLKDLENRTRQPVSQNVSLSGLGSNEDQSYQKKNNYTFVLGMLFFTSLVLLCFFYKNILIKKTHQVKLASFSTTPAKLDTSLRTTPPPLKNTVPLLPDSSPSLMTGVTLQVQQDVTSLRFLLSQETYYTINPDINQNKLTLVLDHTNLVAALPALEYLNSAIKGMEISNDPEGNLQIALTLNQDTELQHLELTTEGHSPELQMDILSKKSKLIEQQNSSPAPQISIKKPVEQFNIEQQYKVALDFSSVGQNNKATQLLSVLLNKYPGFYDARESLVAILLKNGDVNKAKKILNIGLNQEPNYAPFIQLEARILVNEGKINRALDLLQNAAPSIEKNPEYHALIAALYQQKGQSGFAAKLYEQLLTLQPDKAVWWMGLAIALESQGNQSEAKEAYLRANNTAGLNPELKAYVQTRINSI